MFNNWFKKKEATVDSRQQQLEQEDVLEQAAEPSTETASTDAVGIERPDSDAASDTTPSTTANAENGEQRGGFFKRLISGLGKTRQNITANIDRMINNYEEIDEELFEELEEVLITADIGMTTTGKLVNDLRDALVERRIAEPSQVKATLRDVLANYLTDASDTTIVGDEPTVILVIGVNGAGKTTSIGKIGHLLKSEGKSVLLAAADTFRAAAIDQLKVWGERAQLSVIAHEEGSDPAAVVFDACQAAKARQTDVLIVDTAGRLHNKVNLMNELSKIFRVIDREFPSARKEVLLVLDATTGQNALQQAKLFKASAPITGLVLTKLDGTAKGGFVFAIKDELSIPVKLIGVGEKIDDLQHFNPDEFAAALMSDTD